MATSSFYQSSGSSPAAENTIDEQVTAAKDAATTATTASTEAATSATSAAGSLSSFQQYYLGAFSVAPSTTQQGAMYFDLASSQLKIWSGSAWEITASSSSISNTDDVSEGSTNLYFTNERVDDRVNGLLVAGSNVTLTYDDAANTLTIASTGGSSGISSPSDFTDLGDTPANYTGKADQILRVNNYATGVEFFDITAADLNMQGNKVLFGNMYSAESDLPSASTYHGMFAHVHGTGKGYFAHGGNWIKLLDETSSTTSDLTEGTNLYYTDARVSSHLNSSSATTGQFLKWNGSDFAWDSVTGASGEAYVDIQTTTGTAPSASGTDAIAIGKNASAGATANISMGDNASTNGTGSMAFGQNANASSHTYSIALGQSATTTANQQLMLGAPSGYTGALTSIRVGNTSYTPSNSMDLATKAYVDSNSGGGGGGSSTFVGLSDTPGSMGTAGQYLRVNSGGTALEYVAAPSTGIALSDLSVTTGSASGSGALAYNGSTGVFTFNPADLTTKIGHGDLSVSTATASGGGALSYNNSTGAFTFTPADISSVSGGSSTFAGLSDTPSAFTGQAGKYLAVNTGASAVEFVTPPAALYVRYANYYSATADQHVAMTASSPTTIDVDLFDDGVRIASTDTFSGTSNGFSFATATTAATQTTNTSGYVITNNSGSDIDLSDFTLKIKMTVSNFTTDGTLRLEGGTAVGNTSYFFQGLAANTDPGGNGAFEISDIGAGTLANNASMYVALRVYDGNGYGDMDYDITIDSIHLFPTIRGSEANVATSSGYVGFGTSPTSATSLIGFHTSNSNTASDYDWSQLMASSAFGGGTAGQGIAVNSTANGLEWIDLPNTTYLQVNSTGTAASATGTDGIAIGETSTATASSAVALGSGADATANQSLALGFNTTASGNASVTAGRQSTSSGAYATALGAFANSGHQSSTALGTGATTTAANQLMLGGTGSGYELTSIRVGNTSYAPSNSMDLTTKSYVDTAVSGAGGIALTDLSVSTASASGSGSLAYNNSTGVFTFTPAASSGGSSVNWIASDSTGSASATGSTSIALGEGSVASALRSIAVGYGADATASYTTSLGHFAEALGESGTALGYDTNIASSYTNAAALGRGATVTASNQLMLGQTGSNGFTSIRVGNTSYSPSNNMDLTTKTYVDTAVAGAGGGGGGEDYVTIQSTTATQPTAAGTDAIAIGPRVTAPNNYGVCIGQGTTSSIQGVAIGYGAKTTGTAAIAIGSGQTETTFVPTANTFGIAMGFRSNAGSNTVGIGAYANSSGTSSTCMGYGSRATHTNSTALGFSAAATWNNRFVLGNTSVTDLRCQDTSITATSDSRDKTDIADLTLGLDFVNSITPKSYRKNNRGDYYIPTYTPEQLEADPSLDQTYTFDQTNYDAGTEKTTWTEFGFLAQDVAAQLPDMYADARVAFEETDDLHGYSHYKFTEGDLIPVLWKAVQELKAKNDALEARVAALENA